MKIILCLLVGFLSLSTGCGKNPIAPAGSLSFYSGDSRNARGALSSSDSKKILYDYRDLCLSGTLYIEKIEVSKTGEKWEEVLKGPFPLTITKSSTPLRFGQAVGLPSGQYEGVRITIQPKVEFLMKDGTIKTLNQLPEYLGVSNGRLITPTTEITLSTSNGLMDPFQIERGAETYLILDIDVSAVANLHYYADPPIIQAWDLFIRVRATRFIY